ncbi:protein SIX6OS1 [Sceloporus undulatus]|uniref:protein SIX6OS1 n=1 Tax=Sceloporus undulatus TaxID=8520 RepID=UPI001C4C13C9|nr:protein SIX6OS1 [Sceloporus undulatus]XP_042297279.1 protein SIX6OS1 [Sceloporus undulatus]XP_042297292.1 protein SIX6OS1 [Sceloporus undulatus]XP_042297300.1 protein SIX6OS1 [Sceloporus undulatus]XP_042297309.1 protein SIX6OS1 [Sceloporus undulatus]XP_042297318.1 protein SIX6OS1 [Sceloporus undulatus]XP_042297326.1 protein SIX6OS1 [Sceloporus undulatus]
MNDLISNDLDKLLLKFVFQLEQASHAKEYERQQIQIYSANIVAKKGEICQLQEDIHKNNEVIVSLQKQHNNNKKNCGTWKPSYMILSKHEEYLQKELQNYQETTEKDRKMYQDYMHQYQETFKQHQAKYAQTTIAQEHYQEKREYEEIQSRVLKQSELFQQKEAQLKDLQDPGRFQSLSSWALQIASLRQNTKETLKHAVDLRQQSLQLDKITEELEKKMNYTKQQPEKIKDDLKHPEDQNLHEVAVEKNEKNLEASLFIKSHTLLTMKQQARTPLHLPGITQKVVKSIPTLKPLFQQRETETGVEEKENPAGNSTVTSMYFNHMESEIQKCSDIEGTNIAKTVQASSITSFQNQTPFRLLSYQKKPNSKQWFENEATEKENNTDWTEKEGGNKSKDSTYVSQDGLGTGCINATGHPSAEGQENAENFPRTPEPSGASNTLNTPRVETTFDLLETESEGSTSKSPGFSFLTGFTGKSPGFNFFDSSTFGTEILPEHQVGESCSAGPINPTYPCKNIGDLFGKMGNEDSFAFSFPPCSSAQAFQDGKDDFSFPFVFESSEPSSLKVFQSSPQSKKPFSFF